MAGTREGGGLRERWTAQGRGVTFMSPQTMKERLKRRCMEHVKKNRKRILENLRHQATDVPSEVMDVSESICLEDLMLRGDLTHDDYLEVLTSLESALHEEMRLEELELAEELLEAEEAWIADFQALDLHQGYHASEFILCPLCKKHGLDVKTDLNHGMTTTVECVCGLYLPLLRSHGGDPLTRFTDAMSNAFEAHSYVVRGGGVIMSNIYVTEPNTEGKVLMRTSFGELDVEFWPQQAPRACRNFFQLAMEKYYDNTLFHRLISGFMIQGGDPTGTGDGGESAFGEPFADEFHSRLRFNHRGLLAMANSNKSNTNKSQFFFTLDACDFLTKKHTIFGKVTGNTIFNLLTVNDMETSPDERPVEPIKLLSIEILWNPFEDIVPR
ncbi:hypothetical protein DYB25_001797 [Aphanomyces astaci]|uniref:PPIase cyclophilin-type domain-containing protein n=1 Tax=Aphanomyces astaci TaxID=112090 RepID=A0A397AK60_APHAT|nr:hypothetical protein DYB25_001797 [Aphanomyces astaci]RHY65770.1 hypothetical protein DYB30_005287 [Aphanomyces astaci]